MNVSEAILMSVMCHQVANFPYFQVKQYARWVPGKRYKRMFVVTEPCNIVISDLMLAVAQLVVSGTLCIEIFLLGT